MSWPTVIGVRPLRRAEVRPYDHTPALLAQVIPEAPDAPPPNVRVAASASHEAAVSVCGGADPD